MATVTGANFQLAGYFLKEVLTTTLTVIAVSNEKIFAPIIDMNNSAIPQPAMVLMMREMVAERKLSISGSVTTITEMIAQILFGTLIAYGLGRLISFIKQKYFSKQFTEWDIPNL